MNKIFKKAWCQESRRWKENYLYILDDWGEGCFFDKGIRGKKIKMNLRILLMKEEDPKEFHKLFNFSSDRKSLPMSVTS